MTNLLNGTTFDRQNKAPMILLTNKVSPVMVYNLYHRNFETLRHERLKHSSMHHKLMLQSPCITEKQKVFSLHIEISFVLVKKRYRIKTLYHLKDTLWQHI